MKTPDEVTREVMADPHVEAARATSVAVDGVRAAVWALLGVLWWNSVLSWPQAGAVALLWLLGCYASQLNFRRSVRRIVSQKYPREIQ